MKIQVKNTLLCFCLLLITFSAKSALAASIIISSTGNGVFTLQGVGLADVAGIDATVSYDKATLSSPRVVQGGLISGAMMVANPNTPGIIRIAVVKAGAIAGSGVIATINFSTSAGSEGRILSLNARMINGQGTQLGVQTQVINPDNAGTASSSTDSGSSDTTTTSAQNPSDTAASGTTSGLAMHYLGPTGVSIASESEDDPDRKPSPEHYSDQQVPQSKETSASGTNAESEPESPEKGASPPVVSAEKKYIAYKSVLECFRDFSGEKSAKAMTHLFEMAHIYGIRQEPAVALSDGKTRVKVCIQLSGGGKDSPNFAVSGARLISLKIEGNAWVAEALPDEKAYEATITVLDNGTITQIPLTVAPAIDAVIEKTGNAYDTGFGLFLKERGTDKAPRFDLNGDGVRNYIDDYIFTANYIVKRDSTLLQAKGMKK
jgi:hypothetical protein